MSFRQSIEDARPGDRRRLPLLIEVLSRRTLAPVDLFSFYIYMRDQQRSVDYLDFWLDVQQHLAICRHYVREIRRSALQELSENEKNASNQSQLLEQIGDVNGNGESISDKSQQQAISAILRSERGESATKNSGARKDSQESSRSYARTRSTGVGTGQSYVSSGNEPSSGSEQHHDSSPEHEVSRADIRAHAERILYTYLLPGAEREIILPSQILNEITEAIEDNLRDDPEVFDAAKEYVFLAMERDAFPGFLRARALGNMNPPHLLLRLVFGLISLFAGFWTSFTLVFLDYSHATRAWVVLPYWFGVYSLVSHQYTLDPLLAFVGYSEYTFGTFTRMREPFVISLLRKRAIIEMVWIVAIVAALSCIFIFVPGWLDLPACRRSVTPILRIIPDTHDHRSKQTVISNISFIDGGSHAITSTHPGIIASRNPDFARSLREQDVYGSAEHALLWENPRTGENIGVVSIHATRL